MREEVEKERKGRIGRALGTEQSNANKDLYLSIPEMCGEVIGALAELDSEDFVHGLGSRRFTS